MFLRKKIIAIVASIIVAAPAIFFTYILILQQLQQKEMRAHLRNATLQTIVVNKVDIKWVKEEKEMVLNGHLFDVESYKTSGDKLILVGLFDADEDHLNNQLNSLINKKEANNSPLNKLAIKSLFNPFCTNIKTYTCASSWHFIIQHFSPYLQKRLTINYLSITSPPPKYV